MKITIPKFAEDLENDGIKLWLAFMLRMTRKGNNTKFGGGYTGVRYFMHVSDMRYFWRKWIMTPDKITKDVWQHVRLGKASPQIWMFEWKYKPELVEYDFTDPELCAIWGYVIGRDVSQQLVEDMDNIKVSIPDPQDRIVTANEDKRFFQYFGLRDAID